MSKQHRVELARTLCASDSPINKSQVARVLGIARSSLYAQTKRPTLDKALAVRIEEAHEKDDTMGHRKLAALLSTGKNRVKRVMRKYGIAARRKRQKYVYPGKAAQIAPNKLREEGMDLLAHEVVFSDILEIKLSDARGCAAASPCAIARARSWASLLITTCVPNWSWMPFKPCRLRRLIRSGTAIKASSMEPRKHASCCCARALSFR